ncbi:MAG TPA: metallophosphoesterase [Nannocystis sp.]
MAPDRLRRFAALGDLHAEDERLAHVLTWLKGQQVEALLSVGDIVDGAGDLDRCCALLAAHAAIVVRGNPPDLHQSRDPASWLSGELRNRRPRARAGRVS